MKTYPIPMIPGPVKVPEAVLKACGVNYGSPDLEPEFLELYNQTEAGLRQILGTENPVVIQTGEGMLALWSALKSCIVPGDRVLSVATGVFGYGIGDMAASVGAEVRTIGLEYNRTLGDLAAVEKAIADFRPKMITVVHCETPSGTLNPVAELGKLKQRYGVPLLYADVVASAGGAPVLADEWGLDLALGGSQKCLSAPPCMSFLSVSDAAWEIAEQVGYVGYDALKPFREAQKSFYFPYTPCWQGMAALNTAAELLLTEGLENSFVRHEKAAAYCRQRVTEMGLSLFPAPDAVPSPTVTAVNVPENTTWDALDAALRKKGLAVAGSYGPLAGKVFRLGHMGTQADTELVRQAADVLAEVI
ncbi:alanine--glyoxylate aminotransferase family prot ein [Desulfonema ishimotonii]|uniref:Alanine--glyoxylate aminotransferase family prot ein n=1 Tax=Desulfonema ishimotonii TaxID=45657 RepID=A0A401FU32_9BACT|nr:alanine--glyoxylate aminotransferase family protein [Desulfonema ishimotonii]GBC60448.1 alanine--glyoxylate aminotransferase family prot ein [Desulfonema ishimotonii]